jgi:hypothetical protein
MYSFHCPVSNSSYYACQDVSYLGPKETGSNRKRSATCISDYPSSGSDASANMEKELYQNAEGNDSFMSIDVYPTPEEIAERLQVIQDASSNNRISATKAANFERVLRSEKPWKDIVTDLIHEFIPKKRTKKSEGTDKPVRGYECRICLVPLKGHVCLYCEVCSTKDDKYEKGEGHVCINCTSCYFNAKKKKKLVQLKIGKCKCVVNKAEV